MKKNFILFILAAYAWPFFYVMAIETSVHTIHGYRVILLDTPEDSNAGAMFLVHSGFDHDPKGMSGLSHALEHSLFAPTKSVLLPKALLTFANQIEADANATTSFGDTNYYITDVSIPHLLPSIAILGSMASEPTFEEAYVKNEMTAVFQEVAREGATNQMEVTLEILRKQLPRSSPYRYSSPGLAKDIRAYNRQAILELWAANYRPENMDIVIAAPFSKTKGLKDDVLLQISQSFHTRELDQIKTTIKPSHQVNHPLPYKPGKKVEEVFWIESSSNLMILNFTLPNTPTANTAAARNLIRDYLTLEIPGSLLYDLKQKGLAQSLSCSFEDSSLANRMMIMLELTERGIEHHDRIISKLMSEFHALKVRGIEPTALQLLKDIQASTHQDLFMKSSVAISTYPSIAHVPLLEERLKIYDPKTYFMGVDNRSVQVAAENIFKSEYLQIAIQAPYIGDTSVIGSKTLGRKWRRDPNLKLAKKWDRILNGQEIYPAGQYHLETLSDPLDSVKVTIPSITKTRSQKKPSVTHTPLGTLVWHPRNTEGSGIHIEIEPKNPITREIFIASLIYDSILQERISADLVFLEAHNSIEGTEVEPNTGSYAVTTKGKPEHAIKTALWVLQEIQTLKPSQKELNTALLRIKELANDSDSDMTFRSSRSKVFENLSPLYPTNHTIYEVAAELIKSPQLLHQLWQSVFYRPKINISSSGLFSLEQMRWLQKQVKKRLPPGFKSLPPQKASASTFTDLSATKSMGDMSATKAWSIHDSYGKKAAAAEVLNSLAINLIDRINRIDGQLGYVHSASSSLLKFGRYPDIPSTRIIHFFGGVSGEGKNPTEDGIKKLEKMRFGWLKALSLIAGVSTDDRYSESVSDETILLSIDGIFKKFLKPTIYPVEHAIRHWWGVRTVNNPQHWLEYSKVISQLQPSDVRALAKELLSAPYVEVIATRPEARSACITALQSVSN